MAVLSAQSIRKLCTEGWVDEHGKTRYLIEPFNERTRYMGKTFGLGPAGYDVRVNESFWLWPWFGQLSHTMERFDLPPNVTFMVMDKSSLARLKVSHFNTNGEPGWFGWLTLEVVRFWPWPLRIRAGQPIVNIMFFWLDEPTEQMYRGKYQDQPKETVAYIHDKDDTQCRTMQTTARSQWGTEDRFGYCVEADTYTSKSPMPLVEPRWRDSWTAKPVN